MKHQEIIAREGWGIIITFFVLFIGTLYFSFYLLAAIFLGICLFCLFFFRNPQRSIPDVQGSIVAPADGRVMDIVRVNEEKYFKGEAIRLRIFLNLGNVHINRMPVGGEIKWVERVSGRCRPAYKDEAGLENQRNYVGIESEAGKVMVVQVVGLLARRLVCWVNPGQKLERGERFGLIRFGSCTEIYLPPRVQVQVKPGQKVRGGESIIAIFSAE